MQKKENMPERRYEWRERHPKTSATPSIPRWRKREQLAMANFNLQSTMYVQTIIIISKGQKKQAGSICAYQSRGLEDVFCPAKLPPIDFPVEFVWQSVLPQLFERPPARWTDDKSWIESRNETRSDITYVVVPEISPIRSIALVPS